MTEKPLEKAMIQWLECHGAYAIKVQSGKLMASYHGKIRMINLAPKGTPDIHCCINGKYVCIEVKKDEETARAWERVVARFQETGTCAPSNADIIAQHMEQERVMRAGGKVIIAGSIEEMERDLKALRFIPSPHSHVSPKNITGDHRQKEKGKRKGGKVRGKNSRGTRRKIEYRYFPKIEFTKGKRKIKLKDKRLGRPLEISADSDAR